MKDVAKFILRHIRPTYDASLLSAKQKASLSRLQQPFIAANITRTPQLYIQADFDNAVSRGGFEAFIVGSDQCWRPCYSANIRNYYLDFASDNVKKIVYAASFGVDVWEYSDEQTTNVRRFAQRLDAVSVRENTAVQLCKERLGVDAAWVLDPTMLLGRDGFMKFVTIENDSLYVLNYLLEESQEARQLVQTIAAKSRLTEVRSNISSPIFHRGESLVSHLNISVEQWLSNIYNAKFVITDSFHGAVFCIIFNVPFMVKLNAVRGNTRLESLLTDFDLILLSKLKFQWQLVNQRMNLPF